MVLLLLMLLLLLKLEMTSDPGREREIKRGDIEREGLNVVEGLGCV